MKTKLLIFIALALISIPYFSYAQNWNPINYIVFGLPDGSLTNIIMNFMMWLLFLISTFAIISFAISGIQYLTAAGSESQAETAKRNMKYSVIGTIVALSGLVMVQAIHTALCDYSFFGVCT